MNDYHFDPREVERFLFCCGGYRRWELIEGNTEWWWRLGSDWGQSHIADLVVPTKCYLSIRMDISQQEPDSNPAHGTISLGQNLTYGRLGIDGLPFQWRNDLSISIEKGTLRLRGNSIPKSLVWTLDEKLWNQGPLTLCIEKLHADVHIRINDTTIGSSALQEHRPSLIILSANSAGMPEAGTRFGSIHVER